MELVFRNIDLVFCKELFNKLFLISNLIGDLMPTSRKINLIVTAKCKLFMLTIFFENKLFQSKKYNKNNNKN